MPAGLERLRHPFAFGRRLEQHPRPRAGGEHGGEAVPRALDPPLDDFAFRREDADLTFPLVDVDANMLHGWPTLADRIAQGPIPIDEALPIAKQIAEALEAAHEAGVIHRDLKPANIKVKDDGTVKVFDFGLAKALDTTPQGDPSQSPTLTAAATQMGVIMGTAAYMSPEQARGRTVDKRADIWAFGVVLFEMLTGQRVFEGRDVSETLGGVLRLDPDWEALPADTPPHLNAFLKRCLEKEPRQRVAISVMFDLRWRARSRQRLAPSRAVRMSRRPSCVLERT